MLKKIFKKAIMPLYRKSQFLSYHITSIRLYFENRQLKKKRLLFYSDFIKKGDLCFDIGANYGNRTDIFVKLGAKVVAVEPQDHCVYYLKKKYGDRITVEQKGVGAEPSFKDFYVCDSSVLSTFSEDFKENGVWKSGDFNLKEIRKMEIITLDQLMEKYGVPTFIKIDVEGYEPEVMKGLSQKVNLLSFEYFLHDSGVNLYLCINSLVQISENIEFNYSIGESMEFLSKDWFSKNQFMDIIKSDEFLSTSFGDIYVRFF